jgi:hypothetical protein
MGDILKVIGGIIAIIVVGGAVCYAAAIVAYLGYFIGIGCAVVALVSYIAGAFTVCWWSIGIGVLCIIASAIVRGVNS